MEAGDEEGFIKKVVSIQRDDSVQGSPRNQMDGPNRLPKDRHCTAQVYSSTGDADNSHCQISHSVGCSEVWESMS